MKKSSKTDPQSSVRPGQSLYVVGFFMLCFEFEGRSGFASKLAEFKLLNVVPFKHLCQFRRVRSRTKNNWICYFVHQIKQNLGVRRSAFRNCILLPSMFKAFVRCWQMLLAAARAMQSELRERCNVARYVPAHLPPCNFWAVGMIRRWEQVGTTFAMTDHEQFRRLLGWNALHLVSKRKKVLRSTKSVRIAMYQAPSLKFKSSRLRRTLQESFSVLAQDVQK